MAALAILGRRRWAVVGAIGAVLLAAGGGLSLMMRGETAEEREEKEFFAILRGLASPTISEVRLSTAEITNRPHLFAAPERVAEVASLFSGTRIDALADPNTSGAVQVGLAEDRLLAAQGVWRSLVLLGHPVGLKLLSSELPRLRHALLVLLAQRERPEELDILGEGESGPRARRRLGEMAVQVFQPPGPKHEELGALLWDRVNLEEMAGLGPEALASYRALTYDRVRGHWELDSFATYCMAKADVLGRIRRWIGPDAAAADPELAAQLDPAKDLELASFREENGGEMAHLLDGIDLYHRGDPLRAVAAFDRFLRPPEGDAAADLTSGRARQLAGLLRAQMKLEAARQHFRSSESISLPPGGGGMGGGAAGGPDGGAAGERFERELRLARLLATLHLREDYENVAAELERKDRSVAGLLAAAREALWGDRAGGAASLEKHILALSHLKEAPAWSSLASNPPQVSARLLFETAQLCDELSDLARLDRLVERIEFTIEREADAAYLAFLRAVRRLRRGEVMEAWADLDRMLDLPEFPPGLGRRDVARFMEGAEEASDHIAHARKFLDGADQELGLLRSRRLQVDPGIFLMAGLSLWVARTEGETIDPSSYAPRREASVILLNDLRAELAGIERLSYTLDRSWVDVRNALGRSFSDLRRSGRHDAALMRLGSLRKLVAEGSAGRFARDEAYLRRDRGLSREAAGDHAGAFEDYRRAGDLFLDVAERELGGIEKPMGNLPGESARMESARAFERAGDRGGVIRALTPIEGITRDQVILLRQANALLSKGELARAQRVLRRSVAFGNQLTADLESPEDPALLTSHHFRDLPADLHLWLDAYPFVHPINGLGVGRLRYDPVQRTLAWQAPSDPRYGSPVFIVEGETARLLSSDPEKTLLVSPRRGGRESLLPTQRKEWELVLARRDAPLDPIQLDVRLGLAEVALRQARTPEFGDPADALAFAERNLEAAGSPAIRAALHAMVEKSIEGLYGKPDVRPRIQGAVDEAIAAWAKWIEREELSHLSVSEGQKTWLRETRRRLEEVRAAGSDAGRLRGLIRKGDPQVHERLRHVYRTVLQAVLDQEGPKGPSRATLAELRRAQLDAEAREDLLFLCEHTGNRSGVWRRAMYWRAYQLDRQVEEAARATADRTILGPPPAAAILLEEARDIYERLLSSSSLADGPDWLARAHLALSRLEVRRGRVDAARRWLDRVADADIATLGRGLFPEAREDLKESARQAAFNRADLARSQNDLHGAAGAYGEAIERYPNSPLVLWGLLQLGTVYELLGQPDEAFREYQRGKDLLAGIFSSPKALANWLGGSRDELRERVQASLPPAAAQPILGALVASQSASPDRGFWERVFDDRMRALGRR